MEPNVRNKPKGIVLTKYS